MAKLLVGFAVLAVASAVYMNDFTDLEAEIPPPEGMSYLPRAQAISFLQGRAGATSTNIPYRLSWMTEAARDDETMQEEVASKATFQIQITGEAGSTDWIEFWTHPGYSCAAKQPEGCFNDITGNQRDPAAECPCKPGTTGYDETKAKWKARAGRVENIAVEAKDVGEVTKIQIKPVSDKPFADDPWKCVWFKVNTNNQQDGYGNGVYYSQPGVITGADGATRETGASSDPNAWQGPGKMTEKASHGSTLIKCQLASCEEEMETSLKTREAKEM